MQTFLPIPDDEQSAIVLDYKRLGKQRVECLQLVNGLLGITPNGYVNHPASRMWRDNVGALIEYSLAICQQWSDRGYADTVWLKLFNIKTEHKLSIEKPKWYGDDRLHSSHRSNLLRKNEAFYRHYGWTEPITLPYYWPV